MKDYLLSVTSLPLLHYAGFHPQANYRAPHHHPDWIELLLITEGSGSYKINENTYTTAPQTLVILNQGVWHEEIPDRNNRNAMYYLSFSNFPITGLEPGEFISKERNPTLVLDKHYPTIVRQFQQLVTENECGLPESQAMLQHQLGLLLVCLVRLIYHDRSMPGRKRNDHTQVTAEVRKFIQENYSTPITLEDMAESVYLSTYHLCRIFKQTAGISPVQYLIQYRIDAAKYYLSQPGYSNDRVAEIVGYLNMGHFYEQFRMLTGQTPGEYRRQFS
ncbi:MAG: helix-turn-helix transcriptional regulator [Gorillibacterium sp.]|nr:helix-turn-helix transcriptional regulator [Gorillibacterium sp.]